MAIYTPKWERNSKGDMVEVGTEITYKNCVLCTREYNGYDDSDFYAIVWDDSEQCLKRIEYDSTRYASGGNANVDATLEVKEKAKTWLRPLAYKRFDEINRRKASAIKAGRTVEVVKGRKIPKGTIGLVKRTGESRYGFWAIILPEEAGIEVLTSFDNLRVRNSEQYLEGNDAREAYANSLETVWHFPFVDRFVTCL